VRLAGQGGPGVPGGPNGDLYLLIKLAPHNLFKIEDHDLSCELPIMYYEAALGTQTELATLNGKVMVKIPPETQSGTVLKLKGQGMPFTDGDRRGDLFAKIKIIIPSRLSAEEKRLLDELKRIRSRS
jgi:DnaJ-class molecular chaperone